MPEKVTETPESVEQINARLIRALSRTEDQFVLFFALVNFPQTLTKITHKLKQQISRPVIELNINAKELTQITLDVWLNKALEKAPEDAIVFLYDFAELLPPDEKTVRKNLQQINWRRSSLAAINRPLVVLFLGMQWIPWQNTRQIFMTGTVMSMIIRPILKY